MKNYLMYYLTSNIFLGMSFLADDIIKRLFLLSLSIVNFSAMIIIMKAEINQK